MYNPIIRIHANNNAIEQCKRNIFQINTEYLDKQNKKIHSTANHKDGQHGSHRKTGMNPGAGKMLKWTGGEKVPV